jgi:hypothetical protein
MGYPVPVQGSVKVTIERQASAISLGDTGVRDSCAIMGERTQLDVRQRRRGGFIPQEEAAAV